MIRYGGEGRITKLKYNGKRWYGRQMRYKQYRLYVVYPSSQVFATRTTILAFSTAVYIFFLLVLTIFAKPVGTEYDAGDAETVSDYQCGRKYL